MTALGKEFIFIVGAPRSGTTWLQRMLSAHPSVASVEPELTLFSRYVATWEDNYRREKEAMEAGRWQQGLPVLWDADRFRCHLRQFLEDSYAEVIAIRSEATHVLDKHPNYANHMPLIARYLPQARFIHLVRDGRDVALSMMSARRRVGHSPGEIRAAAREWQRNVSNARLHGASLPGRYIEVRYEDLRSNGVAVLEQVSHFCGLPAGEGLLRGIVEANDIKVRPVSRGDAAMGIAAEWRTRMGLRERYLFDRIAGDLLRELGYAKGSWWVLRRSDRFMMLLAGPFVRLRRALHLFMQALRVPLADHIELLRK